VKFSIPVNLGLGLNQKGLTVGLLDLDVYGPSFPLLFNLHHTPEVNQSEYGLIQFLQSDCN
jgi:Mrp family chromosome partitioning ATPase